MKILLVGTHAQALRRSVEAVFPDEDVIDVQIDDQKVGASAQVFIVDCSDVDASRPWIDRAEAADLPLAAVVDRMSGQFFSHVYLPHAIVYPVVERASLTRESAVTFVNQLKSRVTAASTPAGHRPTDTPIGRFFSRPHDAAHYESLRSLAMTGLNMQTFMDDLRDAVNAMTRQMIDTPWDWHDRQTPAVIHHPGDQPPTLKRRATPPYNLRDLFEAGADPESASLLSTAEPGWGTRPPHLLILGGSGTGKSLVAHMVYDALAAGRDLPYSEVNCGGLGGEHLDHQMFGCGPKQWTGINAVVGGLARGARGVVFFDEIGDLTLDAQKKLLVYLQDGIVTPSGLQPYPGYSRIIAATNRDLDVLIARGRFRHDLAWRFGKRITVPPLAERRDEIPRLIDFVAINPNVNDGSVTHISEDAIQKLHDHDYADGNVRELEIVVHGGIQRAMRRDSTIVESRDLTFAESVFRGESEQSVFDVEGEPPQTPAATFLKQQADVDRLAAKLKRPVLRYADGTMGVTDGDGQRYVWRPHPSGNPETPEPSR